MKKITLLITLFLAFSYSFGQIVAWDMLNPVTTSGAEVTFDATTLDPNLNMSTLSRGAGIDPANLARSFSSDDYTGSFATPGTQTDALTNDEYFQFEISSSPTYQVSLSTLDVNFRRSNLGPNTFLWRYSIDGVNFTDIGTPITYLGSGGNGQPQAQIDLSILPDLQNVSSGTTITFRLYGWGARRADGTFAIGRRRANELTIGGSVVFNPCSGGTVTWTAGAWVGGTPDTTTNVIIDDDYFVTGANSFSSCTLQINAGNNVTISDGYLEVENDVTVDGELYVNTQGNFIQNNDLGSFTDNSTNGVLVSKVKTVTNKFVYTYWSSPIAAAAGETIENVFSTVPPDKRFAFNAANFVDVLAEVNNTGVFNPGMDDIDDNGDDWEYASGALIPAVGYAMRTNAFGPAFPRPENFVFRGAFNNGEITVPLVNNSGGAYNDWNLIGNPYPCAIDADQFFAVNSGLVDVIYLWDQFTAPSDTASGNEGYNFSGADYAMINGAGGVSNGASGTTPNRFVPSGQGFFVEALASGNVTFNNSMRAITNDNSQFFKTVSSKKTSTSDAHKLWINLTSDNGASNQLLVSYLDGASNGNDGSFYDLKRPISFGNKVSFYSIIDNDNGKFAIQAKAASSINTSEIIKLGFTTVIDVPTLYKLSLDKFEGDFLTGNAIYLKDNLLNEIHNLSTSDYTFTSEVGEFNERFEIVFTTNALSVNDITANSNTLKIIEREDDQVEFRASKAINTISIFDLLGRQLYSFKGQTSSETYNLSNLSRTVYMAKVELSDGTTITKKAFKK